MDTSSVGSRAATRWTRRPDDRWIAGVASGIADHIVVPPWIVRLGFVLATPVGGLGPIAYVFLWWLLPRRDRPGSAAQRLARRFPRGPIWLGVVLVVVGVLLLAGQLGLLSRSVIVGLGLIGAGALLFLREPEPDDRPPGPSPLAATGSLADAETDLPPASLPSTSRRTRGQREGSFLGPLTLGVGLVLIGVGALLDLADAIMFSVAQAAAVLLLVIGIGLAVGGFVGRARWLVLPVLAIAPVALVLTVLHIDLGDGFGERTFVIRTLDEPFERRLAGGAMTVDLIDLRRGESGTISVHLGAGVMTLNIPDDLTVELGGQVGVGTTQVLASRVNADGVQRCCRYLQERAGFAQPVRWASSPHEHPEAGTVRIMATVSVGAIRINHVDRTSAR